MPELHVLIDHLLDEPGSDSGPQELAGVIGNSPVMREVYRMAHKVTMLIRGESGTGKEVIARTTHLLSPFSDKPFVTVDCTTIPDNLLESSLFGHERGAFTNAKEMKKGLIETADGGTLFFDEIGLLPTHLQGKLLHVLETQRFRRVGGAQEIEVSVRFLAATNEDLEARVKEGQFREDLHYRLNVAPLKLPPPRERGEDVLMIAEHFLELDSSLHGTPPQRLAEEASLALGITVQAFGRVCRQNRIETSCERRLKRRQPPAPESSAL